MTQLLSLERASNQDLEDLLAALQSLTSAEAERSRLEMLLSRDAGTSAAQAQIDGLATELQNERQVSQRALNQIELLNQQISALRQQIAALEDALEVSERRDREANVKIADPAAGSTWRLRSAYRNSTGIGPTFSAGCAKSCRIGRISALSATGSCSSPEVLFPSGSEIINEAGRAEMAKLAGALLELQEEIPPEISWVLRVDGHTDNVPLWKRTLARQLGTVLGTRDIGGQVPD